MSGGQLYVTDGKTAPLISSLLPQHVERWVGAVGQLIEQLRAQADGFVKWPAPERPDERSMSFEASYRSGRPLVGIVNGTPRSPVMGYVRHENGFTWCDDGIVASINPGHPVHMVEGPVEEVDGELRCGGTVLKPIDPDDAHVMCYWDDAVGNFGSVDAMHAKAEALIQAHLGTFD